MPRDSKGRFTAKAAASAPSDASLLAGTLADMSARQIGDNEIYWAFYRSHPWIRACVDIIANAVSSEGYDLVPVDDDDKLNEDDPRLKDVHTFFRVAWIGRFNTQRKAIKALVTDQQTYGCAYVRKKYGQQDGKKTIVALERLDARYIIPHLAQDKRSIDYFVLMPAKSKVSGAVQEAAQQMTWINGNQGERIDAKDVIMLSTDYGGDAVLPSPSPLEALDLTCAMDLSVRKHRNAFFENGAAVGNVLCNITATDDQVRDAQKKLTMQHVGSNRAYKNIALGGDWKMVNLMQAGRHELDFVKGTAIVIDEVMAVYKVPPGKLRNVQGALGQAGKESDDETFEQECVLPIEECLYETLTLEILQNEFEIDDLRMVPARRNKLRLDRFKAAVDGSKIGMTGNELRDLIGLPRIDDPKFEMDVPLYLGVTNKGGVAADEAPNTDAQQPGEMDDVTQQGEMESAPENTTVENPGAAKRTAKKARGNGMKAWLY